MSVSSLKYTNTSKHASTGECLPVELTLNSCGREGKYPNLTDERALLCKPTSDR